MSNKKYQIKTKNGVSFFVKKGEFINQCQSYFKENLTAKKKTEILFSYDSGVNWVSISHFKEHRQIIQNEINQQEKKNNSPYKKNKSSLTWGRIFIYLIIVVGILIYLFDSSKTDTFNHQNSNNKRIENKSSTNEDTVSEIPENNLENEKINHEEINVSEARELYNSSEFIKVIRPSQKEKEQILNFLSEYGRKPYSESGNDCISNEKCYYCGSKIQGKMKSMYDFLVEDFITNSYKAKEVKLYLNIDSKKSNNEFAQIMAEEYINSAKTEISNFYTYLNSNSDYICIAKPQKDGLHNFCSSKCLNENQNK